MAVLKQFAGENSRMGKFSISVPAPHMHGSLIVRGQSSQLGQRRNGRVNDQSRTRKRLGADLGNREVVEQTSDHPVVADKQDDFNEHRLPQLGQDPVEVVFIERLARH